MRDIISLTKPKITLLNIFTAVASYFVAGGNGVGAFHLAVSGYLSVGGASAINHFIDADIDAKMKRTAKRPLPSKRLKPSTALLLGAAMILASAVYSATFFNPLTVFFILSGVLIYIFVYTIWLKRRSAWNIVIGGAAGSFAPLAGWAATGQPLGPLPLLLAVLVFLWTPGHFWALASRAVKDYESAGVPMLPVTHGVSLASKASLVSNTLSVATALLLIPFAKNVYAYLLLVLPVSAWLIYESAKPCINYTPDAAWKAFKASSPWLFIIFAAIAVASL